MFLADTSDPSWKAVHKFLPPALGPKAVRHYAPIMNSCLDEALPIFDELEAQGQAWNAYQYMLKLSSGTVGKIMLGKDFGQFASIDAPLHKLVLAMAEMLAINKKISSRGSWYASLPFGDPKKLKNLQQYYHDEIDLAIKASKSTGTEDLPLQDAALKAANVIGKCKVSSSKPCIVRFTSSRLSRSCYRQQWPAATKDEPHSGDTSRNRSRIHHYVFALGMVSVQSSHLSEHSGSAFTRTG